MNTELQQLLSDLLDGKLSEAGRERLCALLRGNPEAQDAYREFMSLHALLHLDLGNGQLHFSPVVQAAPSVSSYHKSRSSSLLRVTRRTWIAMASVATAASLVGVALHFWLNQSPRKGDSSMGHSLANAPAASNEVEQRVHAANQVPAIAVLGQASRASWSDARLPLASGSSLNAGEFNLQEGLVQIEFFSGASVIIQAPARFELVSPTRIVCQLGKIRAHVPSQARGFTIVTPDYSAVDLGTEFTVKVDRTGESQFQVLNGEVELWDGRQDPSVLAQRLFAGEGARSAPGGDLVAIAAEESGFVGSKQMLEMAKASMQERFEHWRRFSEAIRLRPDVLVYYGFDGHEPWERVLRNDKPNGVETLNGAIVGCQWTTGRWSLKKALEFKRTSDRVRLNIPGEFESLTMAAWLRVEGLERWLSSLMLTDGHELGEVHWQMTDMGQLMLGVKAEKDRSHDFYSPSVLGPVDLGRWVHLACVYNGKEGYVSHFLDGKEVSRESIRKATRLRVGAAEIGNWVPKDLTDYRIRSLNGRVDEFILLDSALSQEEITSIYEAGRPQS